MGFAAALSMVFPFRSAGLKCGAHTTLRAEKKTQQPK
jgi:hypothetical protein